MHLIFDMDNTLTDELGSSVRPGIIDLLEKLSRENHTFSLYTNSTKSRAMSIIVDHQLRKYFSKLMFREDYDPKNVGLKKDIRSISGDLLIDDDPSEIENCIKMKLRGFQITPFRKGSQPDLKELDRLYKEIQKPVGIFGKLFK